MTDESSVDIETGGGPGHEYVDVTVDGEPCVDIDVNEDKITVSVYERDREDVDTERFRFERSNGGGQE